MAVTKRNGKAHPIQGFLKEQLEDAQKLYGQLEHEAQKVLNNLQHRARESRKEIEALARRFDGVEKLREIDLGDVQKRLVKVQRRVVESVGAASQAQVKQLNREVNKLTRKVDALVRGKAGHSGMQN